MGISCWFSCYIPRNVAVFIIFCVTLSISFKVSLSCEEKPSSIFSSVRLKYFKISFLMWISLFKDLIFKSKVHYPNNKALEKQKVYMNKELTIKGFVNEMSYDLTMQELEDIVIKYQPVILDFIWLSIPSVCPV